MKILIGIYNQVYAEYLGYRLCKLNHDVTVNYHGLAIIEALRKEQWDILIIGITLEYFNGLEVISQLRKWQSENFSYNPKIIVVSRIRNEKTRKSMFGEGVNYYLCLPLDTEDVLSKIKALNE